MSEELKNWREMTEEERIAIQDEVTIKQMKDELTRLEAERQRARDLVHNDRVWSISELQLFINRLNSLARRLNCLDKLPTEVFPSREAFLEAAIPVLIENGATNNDLELIFDINKRLNETKIG